MKYLQQYILIFSFTCALNICNAQEFVTHLNANPVLFQTQNSIEKNDKKTRAVLPFIEDFAYEGPYPNPAIWTDKQAYINNTLGHNVINRGVATLDGLNEFGRPYFISQNTSGTADSLTSQVLNLSSYLSSDNIYFSFFYQPQGLGFAPENGDSLFLYFKNSSSQWVRMWQMRGTPLQEFQIKILPITDTQFLHANFQFRFVNIASLNTNDDVWNIDYIKIDKDRNIADSLLNDVGFTYEPTSILSKYTAMPYRHFLANQNNEKSLTQEVQLRSLYNTTQNITVSHQAKEQISNSPISNTTLNSTSIGAKSNKVQSIPSYQINYTAPTNFSKVIIENKYFINSVNANDRIINDTIINQTQFDNYFAYDDGSVEKSYFLLPAPNFPSKIALEFTLNQPDSIRGLMVHFGAQVPTALGKFFSIILYKKLKGINNNDSILMQQDLYKVQYEPSYNGFSSYAFDTAVALDAGSYFIGIMQPANFGSDSIYYGLDVNTNNNSQHLYYNVDGSWYGSLVTGTVMMRPIVGQSFVPTITKNVNELENEIVIYPNPTENTVYIKAKNASELSGSLFDINGHLIYHVLPGQKSISIKELSNGTYFLVLKDKYNQFTSHKIIKQ